MNRLTKEARARILHLLCEGNSILAVTRLTGASKTTVTKLVVDAGQAAAWYQDRVFRNIKAKRIQFDEIWGFVGAKQRNANPEKKESGEAGDVWVWVAIDADTKLVPYWLVGPRNLKSCAWFMTSLHERIEGRFQLTTMPLLSIVRLSRRCSGKVSTTLNSSRFTARPRTASVPDATAHLNASALAQRG